jgi:hypothetical protein
MNLKPGERRILMALKDGPLSDKEIREKASLSSPNRRIIYLKSLRKQGLISRNIDNRKYNLIARGWEMLYLGDILSLMQGRVELAASQGLEDAGIGWWQLEFIISEDPSIPGLVKDLLTGGSEEGLETRLALSKVLGLVDGVWRRRSLDAFSAEDRKMIEDYMEKLSDASWILYGEGEEEQRTARERAWEVAAQRLARLYPGIEIPREIVQGEAETQYERVMMRQRRIVSSLCSDVEELKKALTNTERIFAVSTHAELTEIISNLEEPNKKNLYELYLEKVKLCPKSLIISPSSAFRDYLKRYHELYPEKKEALLKRAGMRQHVT